jgi:hypothetical protein
VAAVPGRAASGARTAFAVAITAQADREDVPVIVVGSRGLGRAKADTKAAESKATITADCAKAYVSAIGTLFEGDAVRAQATQVREQLKGITSQCQAALGGT